MALLQGSKPADEARLEQYSLLIGKRNDRHVLVSGCECSLGTVTTPRADSTPSFLQPVTRTSSSGACLLVLWTPLPRSRAHLMRSWRWRPRTVPFSLDIKVESSRCERYACEYHSSTWAHILIRQIWDLDTLTCIRTLRPHHVS